MAKELEAEDIELKEYSFTPKEINVNGISVLDYTDVEHDKVFLANKKDILTKARPSWIPEFDPNGLNLDSYLPVCVKDFSDGNYFVQSKVYSGKRDSKGFSIYTNQIYKMSLDVLAATVDYYLKRKREELKKEGISQKISLPRSIKSMPTSRYNEISRLCLLCKEPTFGYKVEDKSVYDKAFALKKKRPYALYKLQNKIVFSVQWQPLLDSVKGKKLDLNYSKQDYIDSYSKGEETAYGNSNTFNGLFNDYGIRIKKQNGSIFSGEQIEKLSDAVNKVWNHYGNLKDLSAEHNLKISFADNCMQYARKAIGLFTPYHNAVGVSFFDEEKQASVAGQNHLPDVTLSHEIAHWLDSLKGKDYHRFFASDQYGTLENKIAVKFKEEIKLREKSNKSASKIGKANEVAVGEYWYRTSECFARAMEQYYALKHGIDISNEITYARKDNFEADFVPMIEDLLEENKKHFALENKTDISLTKQKDKENKLMKDENKNTEQVKKDSEFLRETYGNKKAVDSAVKKASITDFVSKDEKRYFMTGIYYENGFAVATDGRVLIKLKTNYPSEYEGKIINPSNGKEINGEFPNYKKVFPKKENLVDRSGRLARITDYLSSAATAVALSSKDYDIPVIFGNSLVRGSQLLTALAFARDKGFSKVFQEDNFNLKTVSELDENGKEVFKYYNITKETGSDIENYRHKYYSFDELPDDVKEIVTPSLDSMKENERTLFDAKDGSTWYYDKVEKYEREIDTDPSKLLNRAVELEHPDGSSILIMPLQSADGPYIDNEGVLRNYEDVTSIKVKLLGKGDDFYKNVVRSLVKDSDFSKADIDSLFKKNYDIALEKQNPAVFPKDKKDCLVYATTMTYADALGESFDKNNVAFTEGQTTATWEQFVFNMYVERVKDLVKTPSKLFLNDKAAIDAEYTIQRAKEENIIKEKELPFEELINKEFGTALKAQAAEKETVSSDNTKQENPSYNFIVRDTAEFEQFAEFEPIMNLTAKDAVLKYSELRNKGLHAGIAISIPGDFVFGEGSEYGVCIVVDNDGKADFKIYGDTFINQLTDKQVSDGRAKKYINSYKELFSAFVEASVPVNRPDFLFEKERELFPEIRYSYKYEQKPVALEEILGVVDMRPDYREDGSFMIYDIQKQEYISSWGGWEDDNGAAVFKDASEVFERLDIYINDYYIHDMQEQLEGVGIEIIGDESLSELCKLYKSELGKGNDKLSIGELNLAMGIVKPDTVIYEQRPSVEKKIGSTIQPGQNVSLDNFDHKKFFDVYHSSYDEYYNTESKELLKEQSEKMWRFDELMRSNPQFKKTVSSLVAERKDLFSSDRECAAVVKAFETMGIDLDVGITQEETKEVRPAFFLYGDTPEEKIVELKEHLSMNGYEIKWKDKTEDNNYTEFTCSIDEKAYVQTILEERGIDYRYELGLLVNGFDAAWLDEDEQLDAEIVTEEEFKRINELREKNFKDLKLPYIKIAYTEGSTENHKSARMESGTVLGLKEGEEILKELNNRFNTFLKCDVTVNFPDAKENEPGSYSLRYDFHDDKITRDDGKEISFEREGLSDYIRMTCSYPEVLEKYEEQWQKVNAQNITEEQKKIVADIIAPNYEKLKNRYNEQLGNLNTILDVSKKLNSSWIVNASEAKASENSIEKEQNAIALSFERYAGICMNHIADYLDENKDISFKDEFLIYAKHQISNMLQDVKYGESRNVKYGEHGYDFDFSLWRKSLEKVMDASEYDEFLSQRLLTEEKRYKEIQNSAGRNSKVPSPGEKISVSLKQVYDYYAEKGEGHLDNDGKDFVVGTIHGFIRHHLNDGDYYDFFNQDGELLCCDGETVSFEGEAQSGNLIFKNEDIDISFTLSKDEFELASKTVSVKQIMERNGEKSADELFKEVIPFSIINNREKGRVNIKFDTVENNPQFTDILKELRTNGWKYAPSTKQWYPVGKAVNSAEDFANRLQEKYTASLNPVMDKPMDIGSEKSPYDGIRFFDRNYNEAEEFARYFNDNLHLLHKDASFKISEEDASTILKAIGYENNGIIEQRRLRIGLDAKENIVILTRVNGTVETQKTSLDKLLVLAKEKSLERVEDSKQMLKNYLGKESAMKKDLQDIFVNMYETCVEQSEEIDSRMNQIYDSFYPKEKEVSKAAVLYQRNSYRGWEISADKDFKKSVYCRPFDQMDRSGYIIMAGKEGTDGFWQEKFVQELLHSNNHSNRSAMIETFATLMSDSETCVALGIENPQSVNGFLASVEKIIKVENGADIKENLLNDILGPSESKKVSEKKQKIPALTEGIKIGEDTVIDSYKISDGVYQATLSREINGAATAQNYFVIADSVARQLSSENQKLTVSFDRWSVIEDKAYEPYILRELIEEKLMPPRDEQFVQKLDDYIETHPLKYEKLKPVDSLNFERKFQEIAEVDKAFNKTPFELGQQLMALVDDSEKTRLNKWLISKGCDSREAMAKVFESWLNRKDLSQDRTKQKDSGYPPRGEQ